MAEPWENDPIVGRPGARQAPAPDQPWLNDPVIGKSGRAPPRPASPAPAGTPTQDAGVYRDPVTGELVVNISKSPPLPAQAAPTPTTPKVTPLGADLYSQQQHLIRQGINPNVFSPYFPESPEMKPKLLGYVEEYDTGDLYRMVNPATGKEELYNINPKTDFTAPDPQTGRMAVWSRTPQANESGLVSASRLLTQGMATGPVTMSTPGSTQRMLAEREALLQALNNMPAPHSSAAPPAGVPPPMLPGMPVTASAELATQKAENIARDQIAFQEQGVREVPAFFQGPAAAAAGQMVKSIPGVGVPMNRAVDEAVHGAAEAVHDITQRLGSGMPEQAGATMQRGLDRFRNAGVQDLPPGDLTALGIQPRAPGEYVGEVAQLRPSQYPPGMLGRTPPQGNRGQIVRRPDGGVEWLDPAEHVIVNDAGRLVAYRNSGRYEPLVSRGHAETAAEAAPIREELHGGTAYTNRGVPVPAARPLDQVVMGRRSAADLSDAELTALIRAPANQTSFAARAEALYEKAWRSLPNMFRSDGSRNPGMLPAPNTRHALNSIDREIANQIAGQTTINRNLAQRITNRSSGNFTLEDLRAIRTEIGRALANTNPLQMTLNRRQLGELYAAVSRDMENGLQALANRAYTHTRLSNNAPDYIPPEVARRADQALRDFRVADRYYRQGQHNMDQFRRLLGTDNPQAAAGIIIRSASDGVKGNMRLVRQALAALRPEERQEVASAVFAEMGRPTGSADGVVKAAGWSPSKFMTAWDNMSPEARVLLFGDEHANAMNGLSREINNISRIAGRMRSFDKEMNTPRSGTHTIQFLTAIMTGAAVYSGNSLLLGAAMAPLAATSIILSRPSYVNWLRRYANLRAHMERAGPDRLMPRMTVLYNQLHRMTLADPQLAPVLRAVAQEHGIGQGGQDDQQKEQRQRVQ